MSYFISRYVPLTRVRLAFAWLLSHVVRLVWRKPKYVIQRSGINYEVDLSEGIDLSLFVFGGFQTHLFKSKAIPPISEDAVVIDVGANVGVMTLQYAACLTGGHVYAVEPTQYALGKLQRNISLNPSLAGRITVEQMFLADKENEPPPPGVYASWKVSGAVSGEKHALHGGSLCSSAGAGTTTLDQFCRSHGLKRLDFIKIDTDGNEISVLGGAQEAIRQFRPAMIVELSLYALREHGASIDDFFRLLPGYIFRELKTGKAITVKSAARIVPALASIDCVAIPEKRIN
jgi:FkbM family methyltransferase